MANTNADDRLVKNANNARVDRDESDLERTQKDGTALTAQERRDELRKMYVQEKLPTPPPMRGFHFCWLSTTNSDDPIFRRMQLGYIPVTSAEFPEVGLSGVVKDGEFKGCISCNEMLLFRIADQRYQDLMGINHYDMPEEQERSIYEKVTSSGNQDSSGRNLDILEGEFKNPRPKRAPAPHFN